MLFINTRPTPRAKPLTDFLQSQGIAVLDVPLLELVACELSTEDTQRLKSLSDYHALMFISETAVSYFFQIIQSHHISLNPHLTFIAVGQKTAQVFTQYWQNIHATQPYLVTPNQFGLPENNEGLLQLPMIRGLKQDDRLLILKGKDGRTLLKNRLLQKSITVEQVDFYQRIFPSSSEKIFRGFWQGNGCLTQKIVLITSLTAWVHWQILIQDKFTPSDFYYLVLQQRIAERMCQSNQENLSIKVIDDLQPTTILHAILDSRLG